MLIDAQNTGNALTEVLRWLRELSIIGAILVFGWKSRGWWESGAQFVKRVESHMDTMEAFACSANENHLRHIEGYLRKIADQSDLVEDPNVEDAPPND